MTLPLSTASTANTANTDPKAVVTELKAELRWYQSHALTADLRITELEAEVASLKAEIASLKPDEAESDSDSNAPKRSRAVGSRSVSYDTMV